MGSIDVVTFPADALKFIADIQIEDFSAAIAEGIIKPDRADQTVDPEAEAATVAQVRVILHFIQGFPCVPHVPDRDQRDAFPGEQPRGVGRKPPKREDREEEPVRSSRILAAESSGTGGSVSVCAPRYPSY